MARSDNTHFLKNIHLLAAKKTNKILTVKKSSRLLTEPDATKVAVEKRVNLLQKETGKNLPFLSANSAFDDLSRVEGNIENFIGMTMVPTGIIGPLKVNGTSASGDFFVPLATSEGALVASFHRGAKACYSAGGATSFCIEEGVCRSPLFKFNDLVEVGLFLSWVTQKTEIFKKITSQQSRFAQLKEVKANIEGNQLILTFEFYTGDAAGQNMSTLCTEEICKYIIKKTPVIPLLWYIESNYSGDKKATALSFTQVRGKKVCAEIYLPEKIVKSVLKTTSKAMENYWRSSTIGVIQSGSIGAQGHYANGLAALFIATGQDAACVAEAAVGITRMECQTDGSLYASVTLPNLVVGTVGGGTSLATQKECLELMDCYGEGKAVKLAEICGALVLAGELSIAAAIAAGHFSDAHKKLGRKKKQFFNILPRSN
jgi:hydroxymethylglutaryl-CoA reductase (NADPH)